MRDETMHYEYRAGWRHGVSEPLRHGPIRYNVAEARDDIPTGDDLPRFAWVEVRAVLPWVAT